MQGVLLVKNAGQMLPQPLIEKVLGQKPNAGGTMYVGDKGVLIDHTPEKDLPTVEEFMKGQEQNKEPAILFWFGFSSNPITEESFQPFKLMVSVEEGTLIGVMAEGEFQNQGKTGSSHSDEYHFFSDYLVPTIDALLKQCDGDVDKVMEHIEKDALFKRNIDQCSINRGVVVFFTADGSIIPFEKGNEDRHWKGPEGWASNHCGMIEQSSQDVKPADQPVTPKPTISMTSFRRRPAGEMPVVQIAPVEPIKQPDVTGETIAQGNKKTETAVDKAPQANRPMISCPPRIKGKNAIKAWYEENCISVPEKYKEYAEAPANDEWMARNAGKYQPFNMGLQDLKDKLKETDAVLPDAPLVVAPDRKTAINNLINSDKVRAMIDQNKVLDPKDLKNPKVASFLQQMGWDILDLYRWDSRVVRLVLDQMNQDERTNFVLSLIWHHMSDFQASTGSPQETVKKEEPAAVTTSTTPKINMSSFRRKTG